MAESSDQRTIDIVVEAENATAAGLKSAEQEMRAFTGRMGKLRQEEESSLRGSLDSLKSQFGRGSTAFEFAHTLEGAGPIAAVGILTHLLSESTEKMVELRNEFKEGKIDGEEFAGSIARALPILGSAIKFFDNIRELITGEKAKIEEIKREAEATNKFVEHRIELIKKSNERHEEWLKIIKEIRQETFLLSLPPNQRGVAAAEFGTEGSQESIAKRLKDQREQITKDANAHIGELRAEREKIVVPEPEFRERSSEPANKTEIEEAEKKRESLTSKIVGLEKQKREDLLKIEKAYQAAFQDAASAGIAKQQEASRESGEALVKQREDFSRKIIDLEAKAQQDRLKGMGGDFAAQAQLIRANEAKEIEDVKKTAEELRKVTFGDAGRKQIDDFEERGVEAIRAGARGEFDTARREEEKRQAEATKKSEDELTQQHDKDRQERKGDADAMRELAKGRIDALKAEAEAGGPIKKLEAERLAIAEKFREEREKLNDVLNDQTATARQKELASAGLSDIDQREGTELRGTRRLAQLSATAGTDTSLTSLAQTGRERNFLQTSSEAEPVLLAKENNKLTTDTNKKLDAILLAIRPSGGSLQRP